MGSVPSFKEVNNSSVMKKKNVSVGNVLFIVGIILVAFNLRPSITSVGPLVNSIRLDIGISNTAAGLLTTLPLIAFAILSPLTPKLGRIIGNERTVFIALIVLTIGILMRSMGLISTLFIGTALLGLGIAIINVLLPGIVKHRYPTKIGLMTGLYTTSMGAMAAIASGFSVPLADGAGLGWQKSLAFWVIIAGMALLIWLFQLRTTDNSLNQSAITPVASSSIWRSPIAWQVTLYMGFQSSIFYCMIAWLPEILLSHGFDIPTAGWMLAIMQVAGMPATFLIPILADRLANQKPIVIGIGSFYLIAFTGLLIGGNMILVTFYILLIGVAQGAGISLALTMFGLRTKDAKQAANLSGMAQSFGYLLAAIGPITVGLLFDRFQTWTPPLFIFIFFTIALLITGLGAGRAKFVDDQSTKEAI